jgi:RNA polymerase sigma factor (sigma-70 family)
MNGKVRTRPTSVETSHRVSNTTADLNGLIDRLNAGDATARRELIERAHRRLCLLAEKVLAGFPGLRNRHEADSVLHQSYEGLLTALHHTQLPDAAGFLNLAALKLRQTLLDLVRREQRRQELLPPAAAPELRDDVSNPARQAEWNELLEKIHELPPDEREVAEWVLLLGMTQAEVARARNAPPRTVSHAWNRAKAKLSRYLQAAGPPGDH